MRGALEVAVEGIGDGEKGGCIAGLVECVHERAADKACASGDEYIDTFASTNDLKPSIYKGVTVFTRGHADVSSVGFNVGPLAEILDVHQVIKHQIKDFFHADSLPAMHVRFE